MDEDLPVLKANQSLNDYHLYSWGDRKDMELLDQMFREGDNEVTSLQYDNIKNLLDHHNCRSVLVEDLYVDMDYRSAFSKIYSAAFAR